MVDLRPGLVLLDVQLPDIDGLMIADDLAWATREPLVVLISARGFCNYDATRLPFVAGPPMRDPAHRRLARFRAGPDDLPAK